MLLKTNPEVREEGQRSITSSDWLWALPLHVRSQASQQGKEEEVNKEKIEKETLERGIKRTEHLLWALELELPLLVGAMDPRPFSG